MESGDRDRQIDRECHVFAFFSTWMHLQTILGLLSFVLKERSRQLHKHWFLESSVEKTFVITYIQMFKSILATITKYHKLARWWTNLFLALWSKVQGKVPRDLSSHSGGLLTVHTWQEILNELWQWPNPRPPSPKPSGTGKIARCYSEKTVHAISLSYIFHYYTIPSCFFNN